MAAEGTKPPIAKEDKYINETKTNLIISIKNMYMCKILSRRQFNKEVLSH